MKKIFNDQLNHKNLFLFFLIFFLFITIENTFPQNFSSIKISGNKQFSSEKIVSWLKINNELNLHIGVEDSIKFRLTKHLKNEGYFFPTFNQIIIDSANKSLLVDFNEGLPAILSNITFTNHLEDSLFLYRKFNPIMNEIFSEQKIENVIQDILVYYENNGFPFAKITIENISFEKDTSQYNTSIQIAVEKYEKCFINKFEIIGNDKTKDDVIIRATGLKQNQLYMQKVIDLIPQRLNKLRFFENVEPTTFYLDSKKNGVLRISLKEKETNSFDGIIGYVPSTENEKGYFTGFVNFHLLNLLGTGRALSFQWQQINKYSQDLDLRYLEPWIFNYPFNLEFGLFQRKQDSTYIQRNFESRIEYIANEETSFSFSLSTQSTIPSQSLNKFTSVLNSSSTSYSLMMKSDFRDNVYAPTSGIIFLAAYKFSSKKIKNNLLTQYLDFQSSTSLQRIEFDFSIYHEIFYKQVLNFSIHAKELRGSSADLSDLFFLGGTNSLRGYREKQFQGNRILWTNFEYRYLLSNRSFGFLFFNTGYFLKNENQILSIQKQSDFKIGYGFGLTIETGIGVLGVSFALGKGDSFTDGKIHFGIINNF